MKKSNKKLREDLEFVRRTEEAWKRFEQGNFIEMDSQDFIKKLKEL